MEMDVCEEGVVVAGRDVEVGGLGAARMGSRVFIGRRQKRGSDKDALCHRWECAGGMLGRRGRGR